VFGLVLVQVQVAGEREEGVCMGVDVKVLCERGRYNRYFMFKKPRAGHVCTVQSEVNEKNGRRG
jgi:hypothetical protein